MTSRCPSRAENVQPHPSSPSASFKDISQHDHSLSSTVHDESSTTEDHDEYGDEDMTRLTIGTVSSRSSISSLPASVAPSATALPPDTITAVKTPRRRDQGSGRLSQEASRRRWRDSPFRHPSSVRSMQMRDEDDETTIDHRRPSRPSRNSSTLSGPGSPSKPRSSRNSPSLPKSMKMTREYPLVLLHCSLLPPAVPIRGNISDVALLQAVLPEEYRRRWDQLSDRITTSLEIQSRGILIPHPKSDYDLLEERLLESLELTRPRLQSGHYFGDESVPGSDDSDSDVEAEAEAPGVKCQDCGKPIVRRDTVQNRKWEVKVYAANGLMRAGAWSAAWNEMEKVDVEVNVWLPEEVKREVEERYAHLAAESQMEADQEPEHEHLVDAEMRRREIYGNSGPDSQEKVDGLFDQSHLDRTSQQKDAGSGGFQRDGSKPEMELRWLLFNSIKILIQDRRNIAIALLGLAVLFYASRASTSGHSPFDQHLTHPGGFVSSAQHTPQCSMNTKPTAVSPAPQEYFHVGSQTLQASVAGQEPDVPTRSSDQAAEASKSLPNPDATGSSEGTRSPFEMLEPIIPREEPDIEALR